MKTHSYFRKKRYFIFLIVLSILAVCFLFVVSTVAKSTLTDSPKTLLETPHKTQKYRRIISMSPSITETLFAIGLGDSVVGVTKFCDYPVEANSRESIGGYMDPAYEALLSLKPDLVVILTDHEKDRAKFDTFSLKTLMVNHQSVPDILNSIKKIGEFCNVGHRSGALLLDIKSRMKSVQEKMKGKRKPKILISIGRKMGSGTIRDAYIAGRKTFYNDMIELAGAQNAFEKKNMSYPIVTGEGILRMNPDIIIDMVSDVSEKGVNKNKVLKEWNALTHVEAVKNNSVYIFGEDYVNIPGPRFILILEKIAKVVERFHQLEL